MPPRNFFLLNKQQSNFQGTIGDDVIRIIFFLLIAATLSTSGCVQQKNEYIRDGIEYGVTEGNFRAKWWNYYERGRSFLDGRFYQEAVADLQEALDGRSSDAWRARTYGMHFVDYFPHRELGIAYYQQGAISQAIEELEKSISTAKSAKAHYFLNLARRADLAENGRDLSSPALSADLSASNVYTNQFFTTVNGKATDDQFVAAIQVGPQKLPLELAVKEKLFTAEIALHEGENNIIVTATDLAGKATSKTLTIFGDYRGPTIQIEEFAAAGDKMRLLLQISDSGGLNSLTINNSPVAVLGAPLTYSHEALLPWGEIEIRSTDRAGNQTKAFLDEKDVADGSGGRTASLLLSSGADTAGTIGSDAGPVRSSSYGLTASLVDNLAPYIKLEGGGTSQVNFDELFLIEGMVGDNSLVSSITINNEPILNKGGKKVFFSVLEKLEVGDNNFQLTAHDDSGNQSTEKIKVERKVQKIKQLGSRMSIAILPFDKKGESSLLTDIVYDKLIDSFLEQSRFKLVERQKLQNILQELHLSSTDLVDPEKASSLGKIISADAILAGSIIETPDSIEVISRLIDTETSTVLTSNDVFDQEKGLSSLSTLLDSLAYKFKRDFPLLEGIIIEVKNTLVMVDIGQEKKIKPLSRLICFRDGPVVKHPVTGKILGAETVELAELKIKDVYKGFSQAEKVRITGDMKVLDKVISK